jgi:hypothetical protein
MPTPFQMKTLSFKLPQARPVSPLAQTATPLQAQLRSPSPRLPVSPSPSLSSFNPALPEDGALVVAEVLRDQFNGLADMIAAVPTISSAQVDGVTTLPAGDPAAVDASVTSGVLHLTFGIPEGQSGPPGEVTQEELDNAIIGALSQTSNNSNGVASLSEAADSSYNMNQMQTVMAKLDELINALRR